MITNIKNILHDFYSFMLIIIYWSLGVSILFVAKCVDKVLGTSLFSLLDKVVRKISGSM